MNIPKSFRPTLIASGIGLLLISLILLAIIFSKGFFNSQAPIKSNADSGNQNWSPPQTASQTGRKSYFVSSYSDSQGKAHIVYGLSNGTKLLTYYSNNVSGSWKSPILLGNDNDFLRGKIVGSGNDLYLFQSAYRDVYGSGCDNSKTGGCADIYFAQSHDLGQTWSARTAISHTNDAVFRYNPQAVLNSDGSIDVVYSKSSSQTQIIWRHRNSSGTWSDENRIDGKISEGGGVSYPAITKTDNKLHVIFNGSNGSSSTEYYTSYDGSSWATPKSLFSPTQGSNIPSLVSDKNQAIYAVFSHGNTGSIMFTKSTDDGKNWSAATAISPQEANFPSLDIDQANNLHLAWQQGLTSGHIKYATYDGSSWTQSMEVSGGTNDKRPSLSVGNGTVTIAFQSESSSNSLINAVTRQFSLSSGQMIRVNDDSSQITYSGPWEKKTDKGFDYKFAPAPLSSQTVSKNVGASAAFSFVGTKISLGTLTWINRGFYDIFIDGIKVDNWSAYSTGLTPKKWTSSTLDCSNHIIKVSQSDKSGDNGGKAIVLDYFEYEKCNSTTPPPPPPTRSGCQGNSDPSAKCFSCRKDSPNDQINIYDFACFSTWYGKNVEN